MWRIPVTGSRTIGVHATLPPLDWTDTIRLDWIDRVELDKRTAVTMDEDGGPAVTVWLDSSDGTVLVETDRVVVLF